jgi:hypothetical protein
MIACKDCGKRHFHAEAELAELVTLVKVLLVQKHQPQGAMLIGLGPTSTSEWVREHVRFRIERLNGSLEIAWDSDASVKPEGA